VNFLHLRPADLPPYHDGLRALERSIQYPIADGRDHFFIDHGARYATFFERMGQAHFLLALDGAEVIGHIAGIGKQAEGAGRRVPAVYGADFKVAPAWRGGRLAPRFFWAGLPQAWSPDVPPWRIVYAAAMRGARGDVRRSFKPWSPLRLGRPAARLHVYFVPRAHLLMMEPAGCPRTAPGGLDLSPDALYDAPGITSTAGCKDLILESTGKPWPLVHLPLGPRAWMPSLAHYLRRCAEAMSEGTTACFSLDERETGIADWLRGKEIHPGATCTVLMFRLPFTPKPEPWVHLATSEI
jgi:hypothetical protein